MAYTAITVTVGQSLGGGEYRLAPGSKPDPVNLVTAADTAADLAATDMVTVMAAGTDFVAVDNAVGVLVADGASPTQAHVTTLNSAWGTFKTDQAVLGADVTAAAAATQAALAATGADVMVVFNEAIASRNALAAALREVLRRVEGSGTLTP